MLKGADEDFQRDNDGIAILPQSEYVADNEQEVWVHLKSLTVVTLGAAVRTNSYGQHRPSMALGTPMEEEAVAAVVGGKLPEVGCAPWTEGVGKGWGVWQFPVHGLLSSARRIWEDAEAQAARLKQPVNHMGTHCGEASRYAEAVGQKLAIDLKAVHPAVSTLSVKSAFVVGYPAGSEGHIEHVDQQSDLTVNICLGEDFVGGEMIFTPPHLSTPEKPVASSPGASPFASPFQPQPQPGRPPSPGRFAKVLNFVQGKRSPSPTRVERGAEEEPHAAPALPPGAIKVSHVVGHAIMHCGTLEHSTAPVVRGKRYNLVMFLGVELVPFDFLALPADMRRYIATFLDATTLSCLSQTCRAGRIAASSDELWTRLLRYHPLWNQFSSEARALYGSGVSGRLLFDAFQRLSALRGGLSAAIHNNMPRMMYKETMQMAIEREQNESLLAERTALRVMAAGGGGGGATKVQRFVQRPAVRFHPPGWLPSNGFPEHWARGFPEPVIGDPWVEGAKLTGPPETVVVKYPRALRREEVPRIGLKDVVQVSLGKPGPSRYIDTDGTDLLQYPWFWPTISSETPRAPRGIRFHVTPEINLRPNEYTVAIIHAGGSSNYFIAIKNGKVQYRVQFEGDSPRHINTEEGHILRGPWDSLAALAKELEALGIWGVRWPSFPYIPPPKDRFEATLGEQCETCYQRFPKGTHKQCNRK